LRLFQAAGGLQIVTGSKMMPFEYDADLRSAQAD
jgi:hypothetical protein